MKWNILMWGRETPENAMPWPRSEALRTAQGYAREEVEACRRRYGRATLHHDGDAWLITLGTDRTSAIWTATYVTPA